jgi:DNA polymerase III epsilon subunit-like protein
MNTKDIIVFDFETTSKNAQIAELTQIGACVIHPRRLTIGETFNTEVRPLNFDAIEEDALKITGKTREGLMKAPHPEQAWRDFANFVGKYNFKKNEWNAPIAAGYNILGYDWPILTRYSNKYKTCNDKGQQALFSNFMSYDLMQEIYWWNENKNDLENLQLTTVRKYMGLSTEGAHDALCDVMDTAKIMIRFMKLKRNTKVIFKDAFAKVAT